MNQRVNLAKSEATGSLDPAQLIAFETKYEEILERGFKENLLVRPPENAPKRKGRPKQSKAKNLLDQL